MLRRLAHFAAILLFFVSAVSAGFTPVRRGSNALAPSTNAEKHCRQLYYCRHSFSLFLFIVGVL